MAPPTETFYHRVLRPLLFQLDPERAHRLTLAMMGPLALLRAPAPDPPHPAQNGPDRRGIR